MKVTCHGSVLAEQFHQHSKQYLFELDSWNHIFSHCNHDNVSKDTPHLGLIKIMQLQQQIGMAPRCPYLILAGGCPRVINNQHCSATRGPTPTLPDGKMDNGLGACRPLFSLSCLAPHTRIHSPHTHTHTHTHVHVSTHTHALHMQN